jgi:hypothetical protein
MKLFVSILFFSLTVFSQNPDSLLFLQESPKYSIKGYVRELPNLRISHNFSDAWFDNILNNRLNFRAFPAENITLSFEIRNRILAGQTIKNSPFVVEFLEDDPARLDMMWVPVSWDWGLLHVHVDRLYADWQFKQWQVRIGRQRINWGINLASNPNDLFNTYSFFDYDYEERPGNDAIRIQRYTGMLSRIELAVSPAEKLNESVAAALYSFNRKGYDIQLLSGYYFNRIAVGTGWAGSIKTSGFKGEITYFHDIEVTEGRKPDNIVVAVSADHNFENSIYVLGEFLYNQRGGRLINNINFISSPLRADNLSLARYQVLNQIAYPLSPIINFSVATIVYPTDLSFFISPNLNWSVMRNLDASFLLQHFNGRKESLLRYAGTTVAGGLRWSF